MQSSSSHHSSSHRRPLSENFEESPFTHPLSTTGKLPRTSSSDQLNSTMKHSSGNKLEKTPSLDSPALSRRILNTFSEDLLESSRVPSLKKPIKILATHSRIARAAAKKFPGFVTGLSMASILLIIQKLFPKMTIFDVDDHGENLLNVGVQTLFSYYATILYHVAIHTLISCKIQNSRYSIKYRACSNFDRGMAYGWIPFSLYQFNLFSEGHASALGLLLGSLSIMYTHHKMAKFSESQIANSTAQDLFNLIRKLILTAIDEGKLDKNEVTMFTKVLPMQNLLILHSVSTLTPEKFVNLFQKLTMDSEVGRLVTKENIKKLQNRIKALRETDIAILENKLVLNEKKFENKRNLQSLFLEITKISFPVWKYYKQVIIDVIDEINPSSTLSEWISKLVNFMDEE